MLGTTSTKATTYPRKLQFGRKMRGALEPRTVRCGRGVAHTHLWAPREMRHGGIAQLSAQR